MSPQAGATSYDPVTVPEPSILSEQDFAAQSAVDIMPVGEDGQNFSFLAEAPVGPYEHVLQIINGTFAPPTVNFEAPSDIAVAGTADYVTTADLNGDGRPDLLVSRSSGGVEELIGDGAGGFSAPTRVTAGTGQTVFADINDDGIPDIVSLSSTGVNVTLSEGQGKFGSSTFLSLGSSDVRFLAVAAVNRDGHPD